MGGGQGEGDEEGGLVGGGGEEAGRQAGGVVGGSGHLGHALAIVHVARSDFLNLKVALPR
eukprot:COSAG06_NODE_355_length_16870_cov_21.389064_4_plen_60_part_00